MIKRLSERIASHMKEKARKANGHSRAIFLSLQDEIEEAVSDGWTLKAIWEVLHKEGKVAFKYGMFRRYALQILYKRGITSKNDPPKKVDSSNIRSTERHKGRESKGSSSKIATFEFNATHNADDYT